MTASMQRARNAFVGSPIERVEDFRFLTGRGQYVDDLVADGMLHAVILRSSVAHGRIRAIDTAAARARPGVHAVITAADIGDVPKIPLRQEPLPRSSATSSRSSPHGKVRYVGEPIAVVVADSAALAEDALEAIAVDIEPLPAVADRDAARKDDVILFEDAGTNLASTITAVRGDAEAAFKNAPYVRREHFRVQRHAAVPMEPRGLLAEWDAEQQRMTVRGAAKVPFPNRRTLAKMMGLPETLGPHGGIRRRRRLRRARRILSGGFSHSRSRRGSSAARSNGSRIAARTCWRPTMRATPNASWKSPATRDGTILALARPRLHRSRRLSAHRRRHRRRATSRRSCRGPTAFRTSAWM